MHWSDVLLGMFSKWLDAYERGVDIPASELSRNWPELTDDLEDLIAHHKREHESDESKLPDDSSDVLNVLLSEWSEAYRRGEEIPIEELARDFPELADELASMIAHLKRGQGWCADSARKTDTGLKPGDEAPPGYVLVERLGQGAFGEVWSAFRRDRPQTKYAVKMVSASRHAEVEVERTGLNWMRQVHHPGLLHVVHHFERWGTLFIVTELADASLDKLFPKLRASENHLDTMCARAVYTLQPVAEALDHLRAKKRLAHQDVKPANLLIFAGICKLGDFGTVRGMQKRSREQIALHTTDGGTTTTRVFRSFQEIPWEDAFKSGATLYSLDGGFTARYASPERLRGHASETSDQYSLALTYCDLAAGRIPFPMEPKAQLAARQAGRMELDFLPAAIRPAIRTALSPEPGQRFETCSAFIEALRAALAVRATRSERMFLVPPEERTPYNWVPDFKPDLQPRLMAGIDRFASRPVVTAPMPEPQREREGLLERIGKRALAVTPWDVLLLLLTAAVIAALQYHGVWTTIADRIAAALAR